MCSQGNTVRDMDSQASPKGTGDVFINLKTGREEREMGKGERDKDAVRKEEMRREEAKRGKYIKEVGKVG